MATIVLLLASLLSAADTPAKAPAAPAAPPSVEVAPGIRVTVPPLGPAGPADKQLQQQVFAFYVGLFGR